MMEFADFDDDLFEEKPARDIVAKDYQARMCEAGWFMQVEPGQLVSQEDELGVQKFSAEYLFLGKSYHAAIAKYEDILKILPESSTTIKRECQENLARCHIKAGSPDKAIVHAERLHSTSRTPDQFTVSYSLLLDVYLAVGKYDNALTAAHNVVSLHPDNSHLWMKLALTYASLKNIILPNVKVLISAHLPESKKTTHSIDSLALSKPPQLSENVPEYSHNFCKTEVPEFYEVEEKKNTRRDIMIVAACLQRAFYILVKTEGTAVGFAVTQTRTLKEKLLGDLELLLDDCSLKELRKNVHQNDKVEINLCSSESASVQENTKSRTDDEEQEVSVSQESFEEKWFGWIL
ncbi:uncharacterized protein C8orf76 homolog isoform X2 [Portunus trituberculatus]|uniref:uncharacterized protein C8orf76 homolog isoform X2 n=1 Tax=Portunus trituberculatus TaxID=210409 RepID=UPI001E1CC1F4|nr:uncharacterized protein C8orf76 homolog isoform X2 [Portunus trituberculatus]